MIPVAAFAAENVAVEVNVPSAATAAVATAHVTFVPLALVVQVSAVPPPVNGTSTKPAVYESVVAVAPLAIMD